MIALKIDFKNAFNAISRRRVWEALKAHPKAAPILRAFHWQYNDPSSLLVFDGSHLFAELQSTNGVRQGCPFAAFGFALAIQPLYEAALRDSPECNGFSIQDDFTIVGPSDQVMRAYDYLKSHAHSEFGLELVTAKCQVFVPTTTLSVATQVPSSNTAQVISMAPIFTRIREQCALRQLRHSTEMESLGVMFGPNAAVIAHADMSVDESQHFFACIAHPSMHVQTGALLLRYCAIPRLGYLARTTHPDLLLEPARRFDQMAVKAQLALLHQTDESLAALEPCVRDPDSTIHDDSQHTAAGASPPGSDPRVTTGRATCVTRDQLLTRMALPLSLGGLGLRSVESIRHAAYFASLHQILPYFARLHPELHAVDEFRKTQVYRELAMCRERLIADGATNEFQLDLHTTNAGGRTTGPSLLHPAGATSLPPLPPLRPYIPIPVLAPSHPVQPFPLPPPPPPPPPPPSAPRAHLRPPMRAGNPQETHPHSLDSIVTPASRESTAAAARFPSPSLVLKKNIDDIWLCAQRCSHARGTEFTGWVWKLQHDLTYSLEATRWMHLFNACGQYQQATLTSLSFNTGASAWMTTPPLTSQPGYRIRDDEYRLAVRHRLGQLPYDDLRDEFCIGCARRNITTPSLLDDPDHAHSCALQQGVSVRRRHDAIKQVLAELARSCGYHVEVEPHFPSTIVTRLDPTTGRPTQTVSHTNERGDLLLLKNNVRLLIDVTVVRPTTLTHRQRGTSTAGTHMQPLAAARNAEYRKHRTYDAECARHGWKMIPFVLESYGAKGREASSLLDRMANESTDDEKSAGAFLTEANRRLSVALQVGNAHVSSQGTADLHHHAYRLSDAAPSSSSSSSLTRGAGVYQRRRNAASLATNGDAAIGDITRADYRCARIGVRTAVQTAGDDQQSQHHTENRRLDVPPALQSHTAVVAASSSPISVSVDVSAPDVAPNTGATALFHTPTADAAIVGQHRRPSSAVIPGSGDAVTAAAATAAIRTAAAAGAFVHPDRALMLMRPSLDSSYHTVPRVGRPATAGPVMHADRVRQMHSAAVRATSSHRAWRRGYHPQGHSRGC